MYHKEIAALSVGIAAGFCLQNWLQRRSHLLERKSFGGHCSEAPVNRVTALIGNTPLIRINSLSDATGCEIYGKAEFTNPGGSIKDRVALQIVQEALASGQLESGGTIFEGTAGSTGVSLSMVSAALGCKCHVVLPDDAAIEKAELLSAYRASVERVRPVSISH